MKNKTPFDEDAGPGLRGADDDEDGDVAAMVAAVAQRDKQLEQDLSRWVGLDSQQVAVTGTARPCRREKQPNIFLS